MTKNERLRKLYNECLTELNCLDIEYGNITDITINTRAKNRFGQATYHTFDETYSINISSFVLDEKVTDKNAKNTIMHEILHTCKNCMNHGKEWQRLANIVNNAYGYDVSRTNSFANEGITNEMRGVVYKFEFKCDGCGQTIKRQRESKFTKYYDRYKCGICGGKFERI